jgi:hypothetical protein
MSEEKKIKCDYYKKHSRWIDRGTVQWHKGGPFYPRLRMTQNQRDQIVLALGIAASAFLLLAAVLA